MAVRTIQKEDRTIDEQKLIALDGSVHCVDNIMMLRNVELTHKETGEVLHGIQAVFVSGDAEIVYNCNNEEISNAVLSLFNEWCHSEDILTLRGFLIYWIHKHFKFDIRRLFRRRSDGTFDFRKFTPENIQEKIKELNLNA